MPTGVVFQPLTNTFCLLKKIMKNYNGLLIGSGFAASVFVFGLTSGLISVKNASVASLVGIPAALITHVITDSKNQKQLRESDSKLSKALRDLNTAKSFANNFEICESMRSHLQLELDKTRKALELALSQHEKACSINQVLKQESSTLEAQVAAFKSEIEHLQLEIEEWEEQFSDRVETAADAKFQVAKKAEIQKIFDEHDAITSQAMQLFQELQQWGQKVAHGHQTKREIIQNLARSYNQNLLEFGETVKKEHSAYVAQIELLNERVGQLQHQLNGDLVEPEYLECGFDQNGKIANAIANWLWLNRQIPLKVTGFEAKDNSLTAGFTYSRSMPLEALVKQIERDYNRDSPSPWLIRHREATEATSMPILIPIIPLLPQLHLGSDFWLAIAATFVGVEASALNHLLLDGLLIPLPKSVKHRLN